MFLHTNKKLRNKEDHAIQQNFDNNQLNVNI